MAQFPTNSIGCPNCGRPLRPHAAFCATCGASVGGRQVRVPPAIPVHPQAVAVPVRATPVNVARGPRRSGVWVVLALFAIGFGALVLLFSARSARMESAATMSPISSTDPAWQNVPAYTPNAAPSPVGAMIDDVTVEEDAADENGELGLRVIARLSDPGKTAAHLVVYFLGTQQPQSMLISRNRTADGQLAAKGAITFDNRSQHSLFTSRATAEMNGIVGTGSALMPYSELNPVIGDEPITMQAVAFDNEWHQVAAAAPIQKTFRKETSYITSVRFKPSTLDNGSSQPALEADIAYVQGSVRGNSIQLVTHFFPAKGDVPLHGRAPFVDVSGNLCISSNFFAPATTIGATAATQKIPLVLLNGMRTLKAEVALYDPAASQYISRPIRVPIELAR
ncbi:MAG TPA: zinc ribbon domain-containing protein [Humisphaera sp.]|nr:zinc ribbon domain-containing protein [Humisphaera sp.]